MNKANSISPSKLMCYKLDILLPCFTYVSVVFNQAFVKSHKLCVVLTKFAKCVKVLCLECPSQLLK